MKLWECVRRRRTHGLRIAIAQTLKRSRQSVERISFELELTSPEQQVGFTRRFEHLRDRSADWVVISAVADPSEVLHESCSVLLVPEKRLALAPLDNDVPR